MKRYAAALGVLAALTFASPALATTVPVESTCAEGWYVNDDEQDLLPTQAEDGLVFDGPSIVHHATDLKLVDLQPGAFQLSQSSGAEPLFKVETDPYSTLNLADSDGNLWWSSRIPAGEQGGQGKPVTPAVMATLPILDKPWDDATSYTAETRVISFGVGFANDAGNSATVTQITFAGQTYDLTCKPEASPSASASPTATASSSASSSPAASSTTNPTATDQPTLPKTGAKASDIAVIGAIGVLAGIAAVAFVARRRRRFEA